MDWCSCIAYAHVGKSLPSPLYRNVPFLLKLPLPSERTCYMDGTHCLLFSIVDESYRSEIGTTVNNNNKFANLLQLMTITMISHFNFSSRQGNSLTSITVAKTHTTHFTLTCDRNTTAIHGYSNKTTAFNDELNTTDFTYELKC